jgi:hypothetical protein
MDELPHRAIVDLEATLGELGHQPAQREVAALDPLQQPDAVFTRNLLRLVPAHLARREAAGLTQALDPVNDGTDPHSELLRCPIARHAAGLNRRNHPFAQVHRIRFAHPCWPPSQPAW